ncbi:AAAP amino acid permease [Mycena indigotica]|uniref:AAAP amino acid permease n=1 Tax=Mycena indigotica TaxID=2126181 RepID=A0A8H6S254_9AGAR|nr:AAAP amino acid permease [Mycena indigotica]KAF7291283.1 AAAP amino acid permease [Mycena indigotica]
MSIARPTSGLPPYHGYVISEREDPQETQSWIAIEPTARDSAPSTAHAEAPPSFTESRFDVILRRQRQRPPNGGLKQPLVPSSRFLNLSPTFEFAGWGSSTRLKLSTEDHATGEARLQDIRRGRVLGQWLGSAIPGNAVLGSVFYALPAVVVVSGVYSPIAFFLATMTPFVWRPIMEELATALPMSGAPYSYLLNTSRKTLALVGATLMVLDFASTSVVSAATASACITAEIPLSVSHHLPAAALALLILFAFAVISLSGLKESARIAAVLLLFHLLTMVVLAISACVRLGLNSGEEVVLGANWRMGNAGLGPRGVVRQLFDGFCLGMLGLTGLECKLSPYTGSLIALAHYLPGVPSYTPFFASAPSSSKQATTSTFSRVLRNLHYPAIVLTTGMMLLVLALVPLGELLTVNGGSSGNLLSLLANRAGGRWLRTLVVIDATVVLCGGVLTGILSACQLCEQLAKDRILPSMFFSTLPFTQAPYVSIILFTILCAAFYASGGMSTTVVSKMFSLVWLTLMGVFPLVLLLLRFNRGRLLQSGQTTTRTRLSTIFFALLITCVVFAGNVAIDVSTARYFAAYLFGVLLVFGATQNQVRMLRAVYWVYDQYPALHGRSRLGQRMVGLMGRLRQQPVCVLVKGDEINLLLHMIIYVRDNEETSCIKLVHFCGRGDEEDAVGDDQVPSELEANAKILDEAFPEITIDLIIVQDTFSSSSVGALAKRLEIPTALMFMRCPGPRFPASVAEMGVRIISR